MTIACMGGLLLVGLQDVLDVRHSISAALHHLIAVAKCAILEQPLQARYLSFSPSCMSVFVQNPVGYAPLWWCRRRRHFDFGESPNKHRNSAAFISASGYAA